MGRAAAAVDLPEAAQGDLSGVRRVAPEEVPRVVPAPAAPEQALVLVPAPDLPHEKLRGPRRLYLPCPHRMFPIPETASELYVA
jgi:hypothetical protein